MEHPAFRAAGATLPHDGAAQAAFRTSLTSPATYGLNSGRSRNHAAGRADERAGWATGGPTELSAGAAGRMTADDYGADSAEVGRSCLSG